MLRLPLDIYRGTGPKRSPEKVANLVGGAGDLEAFLQDVEEYAQSLDFEPTTVLIVPFDTPERREFARRLGGGTYVESDKLKGAALPSRQDADHHNQTSGSCRLVPRQGVVLVVTDQQGCEICFGFMKYPAIIYDTNGKPIVETGTGDAWMFRNFISSSDKRYRQIVKKFADAGYLAHEKDEYK